MILGIILIPFKVFPFIIVLYRILFLISIYSSGG